MCTCKPLAHDQLVAPKGKFRLAKVCNQHGTDGESVIHYLVKDFKSLEAATNRCDVLLTEGMSYRIYDDTGNLVEEILNVAGDTKIFAAV